MKKYISLLVLLMAASAWAADVGPVDVSAFKEPARVACVGDSITAGVGTYRTRGGSYPDQLGQMLGEKWVVKKFGKPGASLINQKGGYQKQKKFKDALDFNPDVVVIMLGTNDTWPDNWKFKDEFVADYKDLISKFRNLPGKPRFFLCYPPPLPNGKSKWGHTEAGVLEELPMIDKVAQDEKVGVVDIHGALMGHPEMFADGCHPNEKGATVMAKTVFKALTGKEYAGPDTVVAAPAPAAKKEKKK